MTVSPSPRFVRRPPAGVSTCIPKANFIWHPRESIYFDPVVNSFCYFRKTLTLDHPPVAGGIRLFADSRYMLFVNGRYIARGACRSDPTWQYIDCLDITPHLRQGTNVISVMVLFYGYGTGQSLSLIHGWYADGSVCDAAGNHIPFVTDATWRCQFADCYDRTAPRVNGRQGPIEIYDARRAIDWTSVDFDDSHWPFAVAMSFIPYWNIVERDIPMLQETVLERGDITHTGRVAPADPALDIRDRVVSQCAAAALRPLDAPVSAAGFVVHPSDAVSALLIDLGRIECGYLMLEIDGPAGAVIDAVYAEDHDAGRVFPDKWSCPLDRFILAAGVNRFEVAFAWKAFRHVQLLIHDHTGPLTIRRVGIRRRWYPLEQVGRFAVADPVLTKIYDISLHTLRLCMQDGFLDSSSREQQQWMGDGRWQAVMNYHVSGDRRLHNKLLRQIGHSQNWLGLTRARYPDAHYNFTTIPTFGLAWVSSFADYHLYSGDDGLFADWWPHIVHLLRWFTAYEQDDGLLHRVPYWTFVDWGGLDYYGQDGKHDVITPVNLMYLEALNVAVRIADHLGDGEAAGVYAAKIARLKAAVRDKLWDAERLAYADTFENDRPGPTLSEATGALAILHLHDAADERVAQMFESIWGDHRHEGVSHGSPFLFVLVCRALTKIGRTDVALRLVRQRYGRMIDAGATATWEAWDLFHRNAAGKVTGLHSASHAWGGNPIIFFAEALAGVRPLEPGFASFSVCPNLCGLGSVDAAVPTPHGAIVLKAVEVDDAVQLTLTVPPDTRAILADGRTLPPGEHVLMITNDTPRPRDHA